MTKFPLEQITASSCRTKIATLRSSSVNEAPRKEKRYDWAGIACPSSSSDHCRPRRRQRLVSAAAATVPPSPRRTDSRSHPPLDRYTAAHRARQLRPARALDYTDKRWPALLRYVDDSRYPIGDITVESAIRSIALGCKNWQFAGSSQCIQPQRWAKMRMATYSHTSDLA